jgi:D-xylose transport system permease protein
LSSVTDPTPTPPLDTSQGTQFGNQIRAIIGQDLGIVPVIIALIALIVYFYIRSSVFLSADNITNLFIQATVYMFLGMAEVWLLLLGEIDLSLGWVAGMAGSIAVIFTNQQYGWPWPFAVLFALAFCTFIGFVWGFLVVRFKLPSFIITLAGSFIVEGLLLYILSRVFEGGGAPDQSDFILNLTQGSLTPLWTWIFVIAVIVFATATVLIRERGRRAAGLVTSPTYKIVSKLAALAIVGVALALVFNTNRGSFIVQDGMPFAVPLTFGVLAIFSFILARTKFGRYMYAIGGNAEAARRAGIPVNRYRIYAFMLGGFTAGLGGLLYVSRLGGYSTSSTDPTLVLFAVAAAVIGGTSLYGGRGKMTYPVIGGIMLAVIINGLVLIQVSQPMQYVLIGVVLLGAVVVDSLARRSQSILK